MLNMLNFRGTAILGGPYAYFVLIVLLCIYISNQWSRYLLNYLYAVSASDDDDDPSYYSLEEATGITSTEYGILVGYGFSFMYVICGLFMGRAADQYNRTRIIFFGLIIWNAAVVFMGMSSSFWELLVSRLLLGVGESFSAPASYSIIADYFPVEKRAQANGIYAFGVYVGGGLSSLSIVMAEESGWRNACYIVAIYGFFLAGMILFLVKEPTRKNEKIAQKSMATEEEESYTFKESIMVLLNSKLIIILFLASSIRFMGGYAIGSYMAVFYEYVFDGYTTEYSYLNASVVSIGGALSSYLGGKIADDWETRGNRYARLHVPLLGSLLACPCMMLCLLSGNFYVSMFGLFLEYLTAECWFGPAISVIQNVLPSRVRGIGIASFTFITTMFGSFASYIMGVIYDSTSNNKDIKSILLVAVLASYIGAAYLFWVATKYMPNAEDISETQPLVGGNDDDDVFENKRKTATV